MIHRIEPGWVHVNDALSEEKFRRGRRARKRRRGEDGEGEEGGEREGRRWKMEEATIDLVA